MNTAAPPPTRPDSTGGLQESRSRRGMSVWEIARLFPDQGEWSEQAYFQLEAEQRIEYADGRLEFLPLGTRSHQLIVQFLFFLLDRYSKPSRLGEAFFSGYPIRTIERHYRLPDLFFVRKGRPQDEQFAHGVDLVVEVVSEGRENRDRDFIEKRSEYAEARIPEYWIVDPEEQTIHVLVLDGEQYRVQGEFKPGQTAASPLLDGFSVDVTACFASANHDQPNEETHP